MCDLLNAMSRPIVRDDCNTCYNRPRVFVTIDPLIFQGFVSGGDDCCPDKRRNNLDNKCARTKYDTVTTSVPGRKRLQSRHPFSEQAKQLTMTLMGGPTGHGQKELGKQDGNPHTAD